MRSIKKNIQLIILVLLAALYFAACAGMPKKEDIPTDAPVDVKNQINRLYATDANDRAFAANLLGRMGEKAASALPFLIGVLKTDLGLEARANSATALGQIGDKQAVLALINALKDENVKVRQMSLTALGLLKDAQALKPIAKGISDPNQAIRLAALKALGNLCDENAVDAIAAALKDEDAKVRQQAAFSLGEIASKKATDALIAALKDKIPNVRKKVVWALGKIKDVRAVDHLIDRLHDENTEVKKRASLALGEIGDIIAVESVIEAMYDGEIRKEATQALALFGKPAVETLVEALKHRRRRWVVQVSSVALGEIGDERSVEQLVVNLNDKSWEIRSWAAEALGNVGSKLAVEPLQKRAAKENVPYTKKSIEEALSRLGKL